LFPIVRSIKLPPQILHWTIVTSFNNPLMDFQSNSDSKQFPSFRPFPSATLLTILTVCLTRSHEDHPPQCLTAIPRNGLLLRSRKSRNTTGSTKPAISSAETRPSGIRTSTSNHTGANSAFYCKPAYEKQSWHRLRTPRHRPHQNQESPQHSPPHQHPPAPLSAARPTKVPTSHPTSHQCSACPPCSHPTTSSANPTSHHGRRRAK